MKTSCMRATIAQKKRPWHSPGPQSGPSSVPVPFAVSSGRAQGKNSLLNDHPFIARRRVASSRAIMCCGWNVGAHAPAKISTGLRVIARFLVPDSRRKFAAAFTRARVEWSEFLFISSRCPCALPASCGASPLRYSIQATPMPKLGSIVKTGTCVRAFAPRRGRV